MPSRPMVDVNLFAYNGIKTVGAAIESVLAQSWPNISLTLIDDGSTDGTFELLRDYAARHPAIRIKRNRCNGGAIASFQRAFWFGDADYVMPKSGDDVVAPDFVERLMGVLLEHPKCAMAHAAGLVFRGTGDVQSYYPPEHCLTAIGSPIERSCRVMAAYTSSPSFWGVYRRDAVDRLSPIRYRAGWDHVLLAELALYGRDPPCAGASFTGAATGASRYCDWRAQPRRKPIPAYRSTTRWPNSAGVLRLSPPRTPTWRWQPIAVSQA